MVTTTTTTTTTTTISKFISRNVNETCSIPHTCSYLHRQFRRQRISGTNYSGFLYIIKCTSVLCRRTSDLFA